MKSAASTLLVVLTSAGALSAGQLTLSISSFGEPGQFEISPGDNLSLLVREDIPAPGFNASTHVLVEGLSPVEEGSLNYASTYYGVNATNGMVQDLGVMLLEMPQSVSLPEGTVSSPIVGVLQRQGPWGSTAFPSTSLGGATGVSDYDNGTLSLTLQRGAETFTGTADYTVVDADTIELDPFTVLKDGTVSYDLSGVTLLRDGNRFYGTATNQSAGAAYDSLLFGIDLLNIPDADFDGIPDITDDAVTPGGLAQGSSVRLSIGEVTGYTGEWGYSDYLGLVNVSRLPYVYTKATGWMVHLSSRGTEHWFYSWDKGWLRAAEEHGSWHYAFMSDIGSGTWDPFLN